MLSVTRPQTGGRQSKNEAQEDAVMEAQIYAPASSFAEPVPVPIEELRSEFVSLEELLSAPAAWAIVVKHEPLFNLLAQALKPIFSNMTVSSFVHYGLITRQTVDAIDAELIKLPRSQWPSL
jgi:hypothetical protein